MKKRLRSLPVASTLIELQDISSASSNFSVSASQHFSICPDALLTRLVALKHARAAEEKRGQIRWLRQDYQDCSVNPEGAVATPENGVAQTGWPIGSLRPSLTTSGREATELKMDQTDSASPAPGNGIDGHRPPLQNELPGTEASSSQPQSTIHDPQSPAWPERLPAQVTRIRQLLAQNPPATAETLSSSFGRKNAKRTEQIEGIIETLRGLGQV